MVDKEVVINEVTNDEKRLDEWVFILKMGFKMGYDLVNWN